MVVVDIIRDKVVVPLLVPVSAYMKMTDVKKKTVGVGNNIGTVLQQNYFLS